MRATELREYGDRIPGKWPHRWLCFWVTIFETVKHADRLVTLGAATDGHRYQEMPDSKWQGQHLCCVRCFAQIVSVRRGESS